MADLTKQEFYDFALMMKKDSNILFKKNSYHNSVYLAGYVLEGYIKIILIKYNNPDFRNHLNSKDLLDKVKDLNILYPEIFENSILIQGNHNYPNKLFNGGGNNSSKSKWNIKSRYKINHWTDASFCQIVQNELEIIQQELVNLELDGVK